MTRNKFPGTCSCGARLGAGSGLLCRVDDTWAVRCEGCPEPDAAVPLRRARKRRAAAGAPRRRKARAGASAPRTKRTRRATGTRKRRAATGKATGTRLRAKGSKAAGRRAGFDGAAAATDWSLVYTPIRYDAVVALDCGAVAACTSDYARLHAEAARARGEREMNLLVTLVELRALGHLGELMTLEAA